MEKIEKRLLKIYNWKCRDAKKLRKKGRGIGCIVTGVREGIEEIEEKESQNEEREWMMERKVKWKREKWSISTIYLNGKMGSRIDRRNKGEVFG